MLNHNLVKTSYSTEDVEVLLKDLSGQMTPIATEEREKLIQGGTHYSEMLPLEYEPTPEYMEIYNQSLNSLSHKTALAVASICETLEDMHGENLVLISLARAGTPVGILMRRYFKMKYGYDIPHYSISIIRGKGIDNNAMEYIYSKHGKTCGVTHFQFVDGWTGKGAISRQLEDAVKELEALDSKWVGLSPELAVLADPANMTKLCGTHEDFLIPSACLNSTVSGLFSRTVMNDKLINVNDGDFHGAVYYGNLVEVDKSNEFIDTVTEFFKCIKLKDLRDCTEDTKVEITGLEETKRIAEEFEIDDINLVKPSVGETTRVLLRRVPWRVLVDNTNGTTGLEHILKLCEDKDIPVEFRKLINYKAIGIIKNMSADA